MMHNNKIKYRFITLFILPIILGFSFLSDKLEPQEYMSFIRKNKSDLQRVSEGEISNYKVSFIPEELTIINALNKKVISLEDASKKLKQKNKDFNFLLQINIPENGRKEFLTYPVEGTDYKSRLLYYSFEMKNDISVYINDKEVALNYYQFERDFGLSPQGTISFSVDGIPYKKIKSIEIHINDKVYGSQLYKIMFDADFIQHLPRLKNIKKWKKQL